MVHRNTDPNQRQLFHQSIAGMEMPAVTPAQMVEVARTDEVYTQSIASSGDRRVNGADPAPHSDIVIEDMGLYRDLPVQAPALPKGPTYELSGNAKGRRSGHGGLLSPAEMMRGMSAAQIAYQAEINAAGVRAAMSREATEPPVIPGRVDPATGRAVLGSAAQEPIIPQPETGQVTPTWAQGFVAGLKSGMKNQHRGSQR